MMTPNNGVMAFETKQCLGYHINPKIPYDGWKYGFKSSKITYERYLQIVGGQKWAYAKLEQEFPTKIKQLLFWYPFIRMVYRTREGFEIKAARSQKAAFDAVLARVKAQMDDNIFTFKELSVITKQSMPAVYNLGRQKFSDNYFLAVVLFLVFPQLNNITSNDPFIYDEWKSQVDLDKPFLSLYLSEELPRWQLKAIQT